VIHAQKEGPGKKRLNVPDKGFVHGGKERRFQRGLVRGRSVFREALYIGGNRPANMAADPFLGRLIEAVQFGQAFPFRR
jgi:hypothetical protein